MAIALFPFFKFAPWLIKLMLKIEWNSLACVRVMRTPVMFISGDQDTFVPTEMTSRLHDACSSELKKVMIVPGGNHNNTFAIAGEHYYKWLEAFAKDCKGFNWVESKKIK